LPAFALVEVIFPAYGHFMGRPWKFHYADDWPLALAMLGVAIWRDC